ncbi:MAG: adenylyl-sulfate kinase [Hyphomonadaceae bacterium]|nr:adenylyl-sulfate kinase [Hyphomonadaceae bacterium]
MLADTGNIEDDRLARADTADGVRDYARLVDGLEAEREQGITIDVCQRRFATPRRQFVVIDSPGHVQYTRNMVAAASQADAGLLLVDARLGVSEQTRRHTAICALMGVTRLAVVINKMDLVDHSQTRFAAIANEIAIMADQLGLPRPDLFPAVATLGLGVISPYRFAGGPTLQTVLDWLEQAAPSGQSADLPLRLPVSLVQLDDKGGRRVLGTLASGAVSVGDQVAIAASGMVTSVTGMLVAGTPAVTAAAGDPVSLALDPAVDAGRGAMLASPAQRPVVADQFAASIVWFSDQPALPGRSYLLRSGTHWTPASITSVRHLVDPVSQNHLAGQVLHANAIGLVHIWCSEAVAFDPFASNRTTGTFILVDRLSNETVAAGVIRHPLRRAQNIHPERPTVTAAVRAAHLGQRPVVAWLTGLSGSGKSTIAKAAEQKLAVAGRATYLLDGDNLRHGLNRDLGFTQADRVENIRRAGEVARLMADAGLIVIASFISPFERERMMVRELLGPDLFVEVFVDTPLAVCEARDPKGLYAKARGGLLPNMTGIDSPYEPPHDPDLTLDTTSDHADALADILAGLLLSRSAPQSD